MRQKIRCSFHHQAHGYGMFSRYYVSKIDFRKLRPMIRKRIENRSKDYPVKAMVPVAEDVLSARALLIRGVSSLLKVFPLVTCKFCSEVYISEKGHLIKTCWGRKRQAKNCLHEWNRGGLNDILVPVETFHLQNMFQDIIKHNQRFDFDRVPAVVELCWQAGADPFRKVFNSFVSDTDCGNDDTESSTGNDIKTIANGTLRAWETLRSGVKKLLLTYPSKVCKYCSEVHVGPSGHKARVCGVFKYESWRGTHFWKKAEVDNLVPPNIVWIKRPQDPPVLVDEGRDFYGHAPAVVDLCFQAGAVIPAKYRCMMKMHGLSAPL